MIRKLHEGDRAALNDLLSSTPEVNLYAQGNADVLGFARDFCEFFGDFDREGQMRGYANRYMVGWAVFGQTSADFAGLAALVDADPGAQRLQDNPGGVPSLLPFLRRYYAARDEEQELMRLDRAHFRPADAPAGVIVRRATLDDLPALVGIYSDAGSLSRTPAGTERPLRDGTVYVAEVGIEHKKAIVGSALTNAQSTTMAMVGGVYTDPAFRGRGLGQAVTSALCAELLSLDLVPVLYWHAPDAGHVYAKLGFRRIGFWRSVWLASKE